MKKPLVGIRTDGGTTIGLGHIRRCSTLAKALQCLGVDVCFFINQDCPIAGALEHMQGFPIMEVEKNEAQHLEQTRAGLAKMNARMLIVDSYEVSGDALALVQVPLAIIVDELPEVPLPADLLINGAANAVDSDFPALPRTKLFLGPSYVLLRNEFAQECRRIIRERVERVLVTTGGGDPYNLSPRLIGIVHDVLSAVVIVDVIVGPYFSRHTLGALERIAVGNPRIVLHHTPSDIRSIMLSGDLAVTGGGQTTYELAATGTPTVAIRLADNQTGNLKTLAAQGTLLWAGDAGEPEIDGKVRQALAELAHNPEARERMSQSGRRLVDGRGAIRVAEEILQLCCEGQRR